MPGRKAPTELTLALEVQIRGVILRTLMFLKSTTLRKEISKSTDRGTATTAIEKETTGDWFVSFGLETDDADLPEKPVLGSLDATNSVGIDLGIQNYIYTSDGKTVDWLDLEDKYDRLRREQRKLSRKEKGSNNYEKQRREVAKVKRHIKRKVLDYQHKITMWLVREYDAVFVEDLNVKGILEQSYNARNKQNAAWRQFISLLEYNADLYGRHVVQVEARGTTKECASCGVETAKPI